MERPLVEGDARLSAERRGIEASKPLSVPLLSFARSVAPPLSALAVAVGLWEAWVRLRGVPEYLVPAPSAIAQRLAEDPSFFARQGGVTLYGALAGFALGSTIAILLAVAMAHSRFLERSLFPLAIMVKVTPIVAIAPLLAVWFGFGLAPKLFIIALIVFFPVMVNAVIGLRSVNPWALQYLQSLAASPWEVLVKLRLPSALPYLFAAFKVSIPLSVIGAVVAEWFSGEEGLGRVIQVSNSNVDMPTAFAAIVSLAALGVGLYLIVSLAERRLLSWHESAMDT
ncbi:MAG: ABC transporter permease [Dehalococcoidia bacterium]|nr:ABC transporter permease [Dehalococcoidia bacterium]